MPIHRPLGSRMFHAALFLFPPAFRREFGDEMRSDFREARAAIDRDIPVRVDRPQRQTAFIAPSNAGRELIASNQMYSTVRINKLAANVAAR